MRPDKFIKLIIKKSAPLSALFVILFSAPSFAYDEAIQEVANEAEQTVEEFGGDPALKELIEFKKYIEKNAENITLKLCEGYRRNMGMGPHSYHGRYFYTKQESDYQWNQLTISGMYVFGSTIAGYKGTYNQYYPWAYKNEKATLKQKAWGLSERIVNEFFISNYSLFLINSPGFTKAVNHCLNTTSSYEFNKFTRAVLAADLVGSVFTEASTGFLIGKGIKLFFKYGIFPMRWIKNQLAKRFSSAKAVASANLALVSGFSYAVYEYEKHLEGKKENIESAQEYLSDLFSNMDKFVVETELQSRSLIFKKLIIDFTPEYESDQVVEGQRVCLQILAHDMQSRALFDKSDQTLYSGQELNGCKQHYENFLKDIEVIAPKYKKEDFQADFRQLSEQKDLDAFERSYKELLDAYLPLFMFFLR